MTNIEIFIDLLDGLYWNGYAEQLAKEDPALFKFELDEFMIAYS